MNNLDKIELGYKAVKRAGNFIIDIFKKENKVLTAEDCQRLKDWYGIGSSDVVKLALSHEFEIDKEGFSKLLDKDDEKRKTMRQCSCQ